MDTEVGPVVWFLDVDGVLNASPADPATEGSKVIWVDSTLVRFL
ncbi:hypothetical protein [uncultured Cellulomonas sp.]|nr:hypothetical protein [uncultured Cellulomonas sp.]